MDEIKDIKQVKESANNGDGDGDEYRDGAPTEEMEMERIIKIIRKNSKNKEK